MEHVGRAIYEAQKLQQQLEAEDGAQKEAEAKTDPGASSQRYSLQDRETTADGGLERRIPIIVDAVPGFGGFERKKFLAPNRTSIALLAVIMSDSLLHRARTYHHAEELLSSLVIICGSQALSTARHPQAVGAPQRLESATICSWSLAG